MFGSKHSRAGFTIVEILMVIAILGILTGLVTAAASSAMRAARERKADAIQSILQAGLAAYYAKEGEWPGGLDTVANQGAKKADEKEVSLSESQVNETFRELVSESVKAGKVPYLDVTGLFVASTAAAQKDSRQSDNNLGKGYGRSFTDAINKNAKNRLTISQMVFGYPDKRTGKFRRFGITYNTVTDTARVTKE